MNKPPLRSWTLVTLAAAMITASAAHANDTPGAAVLEIMPKINNVQRSNYGKNSFLLRNTGGKDIVAFELDVTEALFPDTVFDPEGKAGDSVAKPLNIDRNDTTGVVHHPGKTAPHYLGDGGALGYERLLITFDADDDNGFNPGESLGFSIDMDPNSVAGTHKKPLDEGTKPKWDVGGVSGAELIGSTFTVIFADGSRASGQLFGTGTQAGSHGLATEQARDAQVELTVNGLSPGQTGTYSAGGPRLIVNGEKGSRVRVVIAKGIIQPTIPYDDALDARLRDLSQQPFPANNAAEFQFADVTLTGEPIDLSDRFNFSEVKGFELVAEPDRPYSIDEDKVPLGITAAVIDPDHDSLPAGPVTRPIYLTYE
ncbi:MAG: hypothetical protein AAF586_11045 [Planctomycetota bacterium]